MHTINYMWALLRRYSDTTSTFPVLLSGPQLPSPTKQHIKITMFILVSLLRVNVSEIIRQIIKHRGNARQNVAPTPGYTELLPVSKQSFLLK